MIIISLGGADISLVSEIYHLGTYIFWHPSSNKFCRFFPRNIIWYIPDLLIILAGLLIFITLNILTYFCQCVNNKRDKNGTSPRHASRPHVTRPHVTSKNCLWQFYHASRAFATRKKLVRQQQFLIREKSTPCGLYGVAFCSVYGGDRWVRTTDLLHVKQAL